ncbi:MAG: hypothetical protein NTY61_03420 [Candidatus Parcubacteria bacterium]|nr:hypothetical protein [Candidatus Parcubacteria bacterium]
MAKKVLRSATFKSQAVGVNTELNAFLSAKGLRLDDVMHDQSSVAAVKDNMMLTETHITIWYEETVE